jgi:hypothetical protein
MELATRADNTVSCSLEASRRAKSVAFVLVELSTRAITRPRRTSKQAAQLLLELGEAKALVFASSSFQKGPTTQFFCSLSLHKEPTTHCFAHEAPERARSTAFVLVGLSKKGQDAACLLIEPSKQGFFSSTFCKGQRHVCQKLCSWSFKEATDTALLLSSSFQKTENSVLLIELPKGPKAQLILHRASTQRLCLLC